MDKIQRTSRYYRIFFQAVLLLYPVAIILYWVYFNQLPAPWTYNQFPFSTVEGLNAISFSLVTRLEAAGVSLVPAIAVLFGIWQLVKLFRLYEQRQIFTVANIRCLRNIGYATFFWIIGSKIYEVAVSAVLTAALPATGHSHTAAISFGTPDLKAIIIGCLILLISGIMNEARKLKEEHDQVI